MKLCVAAAAPEICAAAPRESAVNLISVVQRAKADEAAVLVLPQEAFLRADEATRRQIAEIAGPMQIYPLTHEAPGPGGLLSAPRQEVLACSSGRPGTALSALEGLIFAASVSADKKCAVAMAAPLGDGDTDLYDGFCVIAQNGEILQSGTGYVCAEVDTSRTKTKRLAADTLLAGAKNPWLPLPSVLTRATELQLRGLIRYMTAHRQTRLTLAVDGSPASLYTLTVCVRAMDALHLSHPNISAVVNGRTAAAVCAELGVRVVAVPGPGLAVAADDLTHIALCGCPYDDRYYLNCNLPQSVIRPALRAYASTCGNRNVSALLRDALDLPAGAEELDDFFLFYMQMKGYEPQTLLKKAQEIFPAPYEPEEIEGRQKAFYRRFRAARLDWTRWPEGPLVYGLRLSER